MRPEVSRWPAGRSIWSADIEDRHLSVDQGSPDGQPISAATASELLGRMRAAERARTDPYEQRPPVRY